jgi:hypothetical protein
VSALDGPTAIGVSGDGAAAPETPRQLDSEIATIRGELSALVGEADRRRHELMDVRGQVKRHAVSVAIGAAAALGAGAALVWLGIERARRRDRLPARGGRLRQAVSRMVANPERVAVDQTIPARIFTAAASAVVAATASKVAGHTLEWVLDRREAGSRADARGRAGNIP